MASSRASKDQCQALLEVLREVHEKPLPRALLLTGVARGRDRVVFDASQARLVVEALRQRVARTGELEWVVHDPGGESFDLDALCADLSTASLFGEKLLIHVPDTDPLCAVEGRRKPRQRTPFERAVTRLLEGPSEHHLVALSPRGRADSILAREAAERGARVQPLRPLYATPPPWNPDPLGTEVARFCAHRARARGLQFAPRALLALVDRIAGDLFRLEDELEKLRGTAGPGGVVDAEEVSAVVSGGAFQTDFYDFADRVIRGRRAAALGWLRMVSQRGGQRSFEERSGARGGRSRATSGLGELAPALCAILLREVRRLLVADEMRAMGSSFDIIAEALRIPPVNIARDSFRARLQARDRAGLHALLGQLRELELDLKWRGVAPALALDHLVLRACAKERR